MDTLESGLLLMLYEQLFIEGQPPAALAFEHISGGIANGWGMCTTGRGGCVMPT
jgi:cell filamentation protein